jgi:hypothetical protein
LGFCYAHPCIFAAILNFSNQNTKMPKTLLLIALFCSQLAFSQTTNSDTACFAMKAGHFKYMDIEDSTAYFELNGEDHIEYHNEKKYQIISKVKWVSDCQYKMKMISNTIPDFPFKAGDTMTVTVDRIEGDIIYYSAEVKGVKWQSRLLKLK